MPNTSYAQASFLGGEWSQTMQGRFDRPDYRTGMNRALNCLPIGSGMAVRRPGTRYASHTKAGRQARVIKFDFQAADPYVMEFTDSNVRFFSGKNLVTTNDNKAVASISAANPAVVTTSIAHGWATGVTVVFKLLGTSAVLLQNRQFTITVLSTTTFSLQDALTGANVSGAALGVLATTAVVARVLDLTTTFTSSYLSSIRSVQEKTTAFLLAGVKPQVIAATPKTALTDYATFTLAPSFFQDGPYLDPVTNGLMATPSGTAGIISIVPTYPTYAATKAYTVGDLVATGGVNYVSLQDANLNNNPPASPAFWQISTTPTPIGPNGFVGTDVGRHVRLFSEPADWDAGTAYAIGALVKYANVYWSALAASTNKRPGTDTTNWAISTTATRWTWGIITALSNFISGGTGSNIGDMTARGGLAAAFDGNTAATFTTGAAELIYSSTAVTLPTVPTSYVGKNYSASAKQIASATVYPINTGFLTWSKSAGATPTVSMVLNLRAKATAPASSSDGTLLGTVSVATNSTAPATITSNDAVTSWNYVWVEYAFTFAGSGASTLSAESYVGEVTFFNPISVASGVNVELLGGDLLYTVPIRTWRLGLYSDTSGWPTCGTYHEGRLWLAGAQGNRIDASMSNKPQIFSPTDLVTSAVADSNGLSYIFNSDDVNAIYWLEPDQQGVLCGTQAGEWCVQANTNNVPLTPTNMQAHRVTKIGCANVAPARTNQTLTFVQKHQRQVFEFFSDISYGRFSSTDITDKFQHLTVSNIAEIAYQPVLAPIVWMRRMDGTLIGCTYRRDALSTGQPPMFAAGHRHILGSNRAVESICVGPSASGNLAALTMVTNDAATNVRHVEILMDIPDETATLASMWYLDDAVAPSSYTTTFSQCVFNGLWHLNGKTVTVWAGGLDCGDYVVSNGSVTVPFGDGVGAGAGGGLFTQDFVASFGIGAMPCAIGFTTTTDGQILKPALQAESGTNFGPAFGKIRRSHGYAIELVNTKGIYIGTDFNNLRQAQLRTPGGNDLSLLSTFSGTHWDALDDNYSLDSMLCWRVTRPYPCNVTVFGGFLSTQDR